MNIPQVKRYLCAICAKNTITEGRIMHTPEGEVDILMLDVGGFDPSTYSDSKVTGGELFVARPKTDWESEGISNLFELIESVAMPPAGGVCTECLKDEKLAKLFRLIKNLFVKF
jgi:hypothetical protein